MAKNKDISNGLPCIWQFSLPEISKLIIVSKQSSKSSLNPVFLNHKDKPHPLGSYHKEPPPKKQIYSTGPVKNKVRLPIWYGMSPK
jgi:hypothetical protein